MPSDHHGDCGAKSTQNTQRKTLTSPLTASLQKVSMTYVNGMLLIGRLGLVEPDHTVEKLQACRTLDPDAHKVRGQYDDSMEIAPRKWVVGSRTDRKLRMYFEPGGKLECDTFRISSASEVCTSAFPATNKMLSQSSQVTDSHGTHLSGVADSIAEDSSSHDLSQTRTKNAKQMSEDLISDPIMDGTYTDINASKPPFVPLKRTKTSRMTKALFSSDSTD